MRFFRSCICLLLLFTTPMSFIDCREHHHKKHRHHHSKHKSKRRSKTIVQEKGLNDLHLWTYDEILRLLDEVESGKIEKKCSIEDCKKIDHFLALLAKEGQSTENPELDDDIAKLIPDNQCPLESTSSSSVAGCIAKMSPSFGSYFAFKAFQTKNSHKSSWKKTKNFVHKHKKAIIIGIAVVVVVVTVVTVVVMTAGSAAPAATSAAGAALGAIEHATRNDHPSQSMMREVIEENLESIRDFASENPDSQFSDRARDLGSISAHNSLQQLNLTDNNEFKHRVIDHEFSTNFTSYYANGQQAYKDYECYAHQSEQSTSLSIIEFSEGFSKGLPSGVRDSGADMYNLATDITTHPIRTSIQIYSSLKELTELAKSGDWKDIGQTLAPEVYELITNWDDLSATERGNLSGYAFGKYGADIIIPGAAGKIIARGAKAGRIILEVRLGCEAAETTLLLETTAATRVGTLAEDLGATTAEAKPNLINTKTLDHLTPEMRKSYEFYSKAEDFLAGHKGYLPEEKVRELINQTGIPTFLRPVGIPENYHLKITKSGAGMEYIDPQNVHNSIRLMPGKSHSPLPHQQAPYVKQKINGHFVDKYGNKVPGDSPEAHIPILEFNYTSELINSNGK